MKLKGKFHSPKIKRTPSKKGKQADLTVKTPEKSANKVSRRRTCSVSLAGFLVAGTQFIKIQCVTLSSAEFCRFFRDPQGYFVVSYELRCVVQNKNNQGMYFSLESLMRPLSISI